MMRLFGLLFLPLGCAHLPALVLDPPPEPACSPPFGDRPFRVVHTIEAHIPFAGVSAMIGVTLADPARRRLHSALVSVEGLTLFEATLEEGRVEVLRAVPPLDQQGFGDGLLADVALALLPPPGAGEVRGRYQDGRRVCRHQDGRWTHDFVPDDTIDPNTGARVTGDLLRVYDEAMLVREVRLFGGSPPTRLLLTARGMVEYELFLQQLSFEEVQPADPPRAEDGR